MEAILAEDGLDFCAGINRKFALFLPSRKRFRLKLKNTLSPPELNRTSTHTVISVI
jgi:hypothetical protein